jgi:hypothetical protein
MGRSLSTPTRLTAVLPAPTLGFLADPSVISNRSRIFGMTSGGRKP